MSEPHPPTLPPDDAQRRLLHDEVHARPTARIRLPALVLQVAVLNEGVTPQQEWAYLAHLAPLAPLADLSRQPGSDPLHTAPPAPPAHGFAGLQLPGGRLRWERHTEMTRYTLLQTPPPQALAEPDSDGREPPEAMAPTILPPGWLAGLPGRTIAAIELIMIEGAVDLPPAALVDTARRWFGPHTLVASLMGAQRHSCAFTDFALRDSGFERMLVLAPHGTSPARAGRIAARLLELETYRMLALRGLPAAKALQPMLGEAERSLADATSALEDPARSDQGMLDTLTALAVRIERATAEHGYRFAATRAYHALVQARTQELRETAIPGTQTIGEFMRRRLSPAMATVAATAERLASLSQRVERAGALLRTRVDIVREQQNQQLLAKLTQGQALQLRLQGTVEGLSIAAISYYVVSLLLYVGKAAKAAGLPLQPELAAGALVPVVVWSVWRLTRRIHARLGLGH